MLALKSNFYPASEPKNGYIGKADITIANAFGINNISVFEKDGGYALHFSEYGDKGNSYVIPKTKEAYAAFLSVVEKAIHDEGHFGYEKGSYGPELKVTGTKVNEKYADGRYSVEIGDLCTLNGITTRWVEYEKDGNKQGFVSVDMPAARDADGKVRMYKNAEGKDVASLEFQGLVSKWQDKEGKDVELDWGVKLADAVKKVRKELMPEKYADKKPPLKEQVAGAKAQKKSATQKKDTKKKETPER